MVTFAARHLPGREENTQDFGERGDPTQGRDSSIQHGRMEHRECPSSNIAGYLLQVLQGNPDQVRCFGEFYAPLWPSRFFCATYKIPEESIYVGIRLNSL